MEPERIVLWQLVLRGETQINQLLRLRTIASRMEGGKRARNQWGQTRSIATHGLTIRHPGGGSVIDDKDACYR